jgi:hypothetical protein
MTKVQRPIGKGQRAADKDSASSGHAKLCHVGAGRSRRRPGACSKILADGV